VDRGKEHKTAEEKKAILEETLATIKRLVEGGIQGNITLPAYDGIIGKLKFELFVEPLKAKELFKMGG